MASLYQSLTCEREDTLVVRDANNDALAYVYFEEEPGRRSAAHLLTRDDARRIAAFKGGGARPSGTGPNPSPNV